MSTWPAGSSPGFSSRGAKNHKGRHIFETLYWMYAATRGPNVKWGGTDFKWEGRAPLPPPLATTLMASQAKCDIVFKLMS